jgi:hypothetical protein
MVAFNVQQSFLINAGQDLGLDRHLWKSNYFYRGISKRSQGVQDAAN